MIAVAVGPEFLAVDHVSRTVPDLAEALRFYAEAFGAVVLYQLSPIDGAAIPPDAQRRDWMETHVSVKGIRLTLTMGR